MPVKKQKTIKVLPKMKQNKNIAMKTQSNKTVVKDVSRSVKKSSPKTKVLSNNKKVGNSENKTESKSFYDSSLLLPTNMSQRAVEKSIVLKREFGDYFHHSMYKIAYVAGLCFLLVGSTLMASNVLSPDISQRMLGQVQSFESESLLTSEIPNPEFHLTEQIPSQLNEVYKVIFAVTNTSLVSSQLVKIGETGFYPQSTDILPDNKYKVIVPTTSLSPGYYKLVFFVKPLNGSKGVVFDTKEFHVGPVDTIIEQPKQDLQTSNSEVNTSVENITESTVKTESQLPVAPQGTIFSLIGPQDNILTGTETIAVSTPDSYSYIELYARPVQSLTPRFVSLASKRFERWQFIVNSTNIPNGKYEFFAKTTYNGKKLETKSIILTVNNATVATPLKTNLSEQDTESVTKDPVTLTQNRALFKPADNSDNYLPYTNNNVIAADETNQLIRDNTSDIVMLINRYAVARQSGDEILIETARQALKEKRESIVSKTLEDGRLRDMSNDIDKNLIERIDDLQNRVDTFEQIRKDRSDGKTAIDTDKDGISDYDEKTLYGTNPESADTDNDGVTDGIEIMRGYNPLSSESEAVIQFESPRDSIGLARHDSLKVNTVSPVIRVDSNDEEVSSVRTEIKGVGLSDSFVTLYIFSTPTVVTIRTDADGSFAYTFDKELEDGRHDIYVAVTDNAGKIIAQSNPFSFIKKAEAFTPVDAAESEVLTSDVISESSGGTYNVVVGIGILSLGIILLMLGISLRTKEESTNLIKQAKDTPSADTPTDQNDKKVSSKFEHIDAS